MLISMSFAGGRRCAGMENGEQARKIANKRGGLLNIHYAKVIGAGRALRELPINTTIVFPIVFMYRKHPYNRD